MRVRETSTEIIIRCPACGQHCVPKTRWTLSGTADAPTIHPSIVETCNPPGSRDYRPDAATTVCHIVIRDGRIEFQSDCTHALAGQTFDLPEFVLPEVPS